MTDQLLQLLLGYGTLALLPVIAGAAVGLPLPASLLLLAAGAFAGGGPLAVVPLLIVSFAGAVAGDNLGYWLGWRGGRPALTRWGRQFHIAEEALVRAERGLARWGGLSVLLTRFLLTPFGPAINILAGVARYPHRSFLLYDALGEAIWVGSYVGLGYAFSASWDVLAELLGGGTRLVSLLVVVIGLGALLRRTVRDDGGAEETPATAVTAVVAAHSQEGVADEPD